MRSLVLIVLIGILLFPACFGQKITLTDLTTLCSKSNWEDVNEILLGKGWTYYDSKRGNSWRYNMITWSYNKDSYSEKAWAWFHLYTYEGYPNKINYSVFNKESYSIIQKSIAATGFKLKSSEIQDNQIISVYANNNYELTVATQRREDIDYSWDSNSVTAYDFTLVKKSGIYDPNNGRKTEYYYDDVVQLEYTLKDGKIHGEIKVYHENGNLKKVGNYKNGVENGLFKEFDEFGSIEVEYNMLNGILSGSVKYYYPNGNLRRAGKHNGGKESGEFVEYDEFGAKTAEYVMLNGARNGVFKVYKEGKIDVLTTYVDDIRNGVYENYFYDEETGKLEFKQLGEYADDQMTGSWKLVFIEDDADERVLTYYNYIGGMRNGPFQEIVGDSLIVGSYKGNKLHGNYKAYLDVTRAFLGGEMNTNIDSLTLVVEGEYYEGEKSGYWRFYDFTKTLRSEGSFVNGLEHGEWKYYYANWTDLEGIPRLYAKELFLVLNYSNGKLNGRSTRYSYLEEELYPCSEGDDSALAQDTCRRNVYNKVLEVAYYKGGKLDGPFEVRDSTNTIVAKGSFKDDLKDGEWLHRYVNTEVNEQVYIFYESGNYIRDKREGKWLQYHNEGDLIASFYYRNGEFHGEYVLYNESNEIKEKKEFRNGKLTDVIFYDSLGVRPVRRLEIYDEKDISLRCRASDYFENGYASQEYWMEKKGEIDHQWFEIVFMLSIEGDDSDEMTGYRDGAYQLFDKDNRPLVSGKYFKENRIGLWSFYYYDQGVKIESNYFRGQIMDEKYFTLSGELYSGDFVYDDLGNKIREERRIKHGLRNGKTVYIDTDTNKILKKENYKNGTLK
jgi:antitoxin component YwqK of YwqJK toxin-antitoxin module